VINIFTMTVASYRIPGHWMLATY